MTNKLEELKTQVESLKKHWTILKVKDLGGHAFIMNVSSTTVVTGNYGEQTLIVGTIGQNELEMKEGDSCRIYLNNKRMETFDNAYTEPGAYAFIFGDAVELKSGHTYIPLELVSKV